MLQQKLSGPERAISTLSALFAVGAAAALFGPTAARAQSIAQYGLYNTGINPAGMIGMEGLDSEYTVTYEAGSGPANDPGVPLTDNSLYVTSTLNSGGYQFLPWQPADNSTSAFIAPFTSYADGKSNLGGTYDIVTSFDLSSVSNLSTVQLFGRFESDDYIEDVLINNKSLGISSVYPAYEAFSKYYNLVPDSSYLLPGINTLTFKVYNIPTGTNTDPVALRTEFSVSAVPEPSTWAMVGGLVSLVAFGSGLRRRRATVPVANS